MDNTKQKATKQIVWGEFGTVKKRLDEVREVRGPVTKRKYFWYEPGQALMMDKRDHDALFLVTKATKTKDGEQ